MHEGNVGISLQVIWNGTFFQSWLSPCRKQGISLPCQRGKPDELRRLFLILIYCLIVCSNQQGKQWRSSWSHARMLFSFGTLLQQQLGIFLQHCAPELSAGNTLSHTSELLKHCVPSLHLLQSSPDPALLLAWSFNPLGSPTGHSSLVRPKKPSSYI